MENSGQIKPFGAVLLRHHDDLLVGNDIRKRGVLDEGDDLVAHGRQDALDHLQRRDAEKDLGPGHAQHLPGLGLALWGTASMPPR